MYHIPKYRSPEPPALKKPSSYFWPDETNVWLSFMDRVAVTLSAAIELFGNKKYQSERNSEKQEAVLGGTCVCYMYLKTYILKTCV